MVYLSLQRELNHQICGFCTAPYEFRHDNAGKAGDFQCDEVDAHRRTAQLVFVANGYLQHAVSASNCTYYNRYQMYINIQGPESVHAVSFTYGCNLTKASETRKPFPDISEVHTVPTAPQPYNNANPQGGVGGDNMDLGRKTRQVKNE